MKPNDESTYRYLRGLEMSCQQLIFELPVESNPFSDELDAPYWEIQATIEFVSRLQRYAAKAATRVFMEGKE